MPDLLPRSRRPYDRFETIFPASPSQGDPVALDPVTVRVGKTRDGRDLTPGTPWQHFVRPMTALESEILHYLHKRSYEKARFWLQGRDAENAQGNCGHV